jgi:hypothetical protein
MTEAVIVALITAVGAVLGQWLISRRQNEDRKTADAVRDARIDDRMAAVEKKLDIHNGYAEKLGEIQQDIAVIKTEISMIQRGAQ